MAADGRPAAGDGVAASALKDGRRMIEAVVRAEEAVAVGVKAVHWRVHSEYGEVIAALAVFSLVVNCAALDFHLAGGEVALEVGGIVLRVPQAELHKAEQGNVLGRIRAVFELHARDQRIDAARNHRRLAHEKTVLFAGERRVAQPVTALIGVERGFDRHPARGEHRVAVLDIEVLSAGVGGHVVVAVAGDAQHARILVEAVAAACVGHQGEKRLAAQVVDPRGGGVRAGDDIFPGRIVEMTIFHGAIASFIRRICRNIAGCVENDLDYHCTTAWFFYNIPHFCSESKGFLMISAQKIENVFEN